MTQGSPKTLEQIMPSSVELSHSNFQSDWEQLIRSAFDTGKTEVKNIGKIDIPGIGLCEEQLFASEGHSGPNVGAQLQNDDMMLKYACKCFMGNPEAYGAIMIAEPYLETLSTNKSVSAPANVAGSFAMKLSLRYDEYIVQAVANALGQRVLHTIEVGYDESSIKTQYRSLGYSVRRNHSNIFDKIYHPKK